MPAEIIQPLLNHLWEMLGEPSKVSGSAIAGLLFLFKYTRSKLKEMDQMEQHISELELKITFLTERIDDLKDVILSSKQYIEVIKK
jgi:hypothetical protein